MLYAHVNNDHISIMEDDGGNENEIVGWHSDEWKEDPEMVVPAIANAIMLCYENPEGLKELLAAVGK